jgi:hypothetical protein
MSDQQVPPEEPQLPAEALARLEEANREDAHRAHDKLEEFHKYVNEAAIKGGEITLRTAILINGGAAIALLGFVGSLPKEHKAAFASTLLWFAGGVAAAALGIGLSYFTHYFMAGVAAHYERAWTHPWVRPTAASRRYRILNIIFHVAAVVAATLSWVTFIVGMIEVRNAIAAIS